MPVTNSLCFFYVNLFFKVCLQRDCTQKLGSGSLALLLDITHLALTCISSRVFWFWYKKGGNIQLNSVIYNH